VTTYTTPKLHLDHFFNEIDYVDSRDDPWLCAKRFKKLALPSMNTLPQIMRLHITPDINGSWSFSHGGVRLGQTRSVFLYLAAIDWLEDRHITRFSAEMELIET